MLQFAHRYADCNTMLMQFDTRVGSGPTAAILELLPLVTL